MAIQEQPHTSPDQDDRDALAEAAMNRRRFLANLGRGLGAAALGSAFLGSLETAAARVAPLPAEVAASDEDFWFQIQQAFTVGRTILNLNNGGVSPSPRIVTEALVRYIWQQEDNTAYQVLQAMVPQVEAVRRGLAEIFGCDGEEIAITRNSSEALEILLMGLSLRSGDEILTTTQDYPRMLTTLRQRERREGLVLKMVKVPVPAKDTGELIAAFERGITPKTRVILMAHVINITGQIMPVKEVCALARARGIEVIVDGAHSFAHLDFKQADLGCDYYGTSLHKWLYAPKGTGMLYVKRDRIPKVWPLFAASDKQTSDIRKYEEIGTQSMAIKLAIGEAILFHNGIGAHRKEARLRYLARYWQNKLASLPRVRLNTSLDEKQSCGVGNVQIEGISAAALAEHLIKAHRIYTAAITHEEFQGIRVTPNLYTTVKELDRFCEIMEDLAKRGLS